MKIALCLSGGRLYWCDNGRNHIESSDLLGRNRTVIVNNITPFGMVIFNEYIYFTDISTDAILRVNLHTTIVDGSWCRKIGGALRLNIYKGWMKCGCIVSKSYII